MPTLILELMANYFNIEKSDLIEKHTEDEKLPTNGECERKSVNKYKPIAFYDRIIKGGYLKWQKKK